MGGTSGEPFASLHSLPAQEINCRMSVRLLSILYREVGGAQWLK